MCMSYIRSSHPCNWCSVLPCFQSCCSACNHLLHTVQLRVFKYAQHVLSLAGWAFTKLDMVKQVPDFWTAMGASVQRKAWLVWAITFRVFRLSFQSCTAWRVWVLNASPYCGGSRGAPRGPFDALCHANKALLSLVSRQRARLLCGGDVCIPLSCDFVHVLKLGPRALSNGNA